MPNTRLSASRLSRTTESPICATAAAAPNSLSSNSHIANAAAAAMIGARIGFGEASMANAARIRAKPGLRVIDATPASLLFALAEHQAHRVHGGDEDDRRA